MTTAIKSGEVFEYQGQRVTIDGDYSRNSAYISVILNGQRIVVSKYDLFNMNSNERLTNMYDKQIAHNKEVIEENKNLWTACRDSIKNFRFQMNTILDSLGLTAAWQIKDEEQRNRYDALLNQSSDARRAQIRATASIISAAHNTTSAAISKMSATFA